VCLLVVELAVSRFPDLTFSSSVCSSRSLRLHFIFLNKLNVCDKFKYGFVTAQSVTNLIESQRYYMRRKTGQLTVPVRDDRLHIRKGRLHYLFLNAEPGSLDTVTSYYGRKD
jgi:hypothetical protein